MNAKHLDTFAELIASFEVLIDTLEDMFMAIEEKNQNFAQFFTIVYLRTINWKAESNL